MVQKIVKDDVEYTLVEVLTEDVDLDEVGDYSAGDYVLEDAEGNQIIMDAVKAEGIFNFVVDLEKELTKAYYKDEVIEGETFRFGGLNFRNIFSQRQKVNKGDFIVVRNNIMAYKIPKDVLERDYEDL